MAKVTSKYQVTLPKAIANQFKIRPGDDIEWVAAGDAIRVIPAGRDRPADSREAKLHLYDQATQRIRARSTGRKKATSNQRGWRREDLYTRGRSR